MSCCGQSSEQAQANTAALIDEGAAAGVLVKLVYVGEDKRTQTFVVDGKIYQFGNNERRRVNAVSARVVPTFLRGRWAGQFVAYDPVLYNADGSRVGGEPSASPAPDKAAMATGSPKVKVAK